MNISGVLIGKSILQISAGFRHTCAITNDGKTYCFGDNR
jgi:alpha-tubulin suppressor-like RCC1 family protein